jgi:pimeloyl-ACP methyl ester carboxylesterase
MYAQACAFALQSRVSHLGLVASVIPPDWPGMMTEINRMDRSFIRLSTSGAPVEKSIFMVMRTVARHTPEALTRRSRLPDAVTAGMKAAMAQALTDPDGAVEEYRLLGASWGFDPASIAVATDIWQGTNDHMVPVEWGRRLAAAIPDSRLTIVEGGSHFLMYEAWDEILNALIAGADDRFADE